MKKTLADALSAKGYDTLTAVQEACLNPEVEGRDLLVSAQTGSGKTIGFGLAIAPQILGDGDRFDRADAPLALVIAPTRELAMQVKRELDWLYKAAGAVVVSTVGGMDMRDERRALERGSHIVVATPGRLRDHVMRKSIDMDSLKAVVLDEADEMLDLGFREDLEFILDSAPEDRQTLLFSATVPASIAKLAKSYQKDAMRIETVSATSQHADIEYRALRVSARDGENAIMNVLRYYEAPNAIVFCNTRATVNRLTTRLSNRGLSVVALSGELSQSERTHALQAMRDGRARVCVATDVAARGIDLPNLELVIHAELPTNQDTLLHRSGRTGRAGRKGVSAMIVPPASRRKAERLLGWAKLTATWADAPGADEVLAKDEERMLGNPSWLEPVADGERETVEKLTKAFTAEQIAASYLRLYRERNTAPEDLADVGAAPAPRAAFGASVWFSLAGGRATGADPRRLLPMLCKMGNITKDDIGAIRIQPKESMFEIRDTAVDGFLKAVGSAMTMEDGAILMRLNGKPKLDPQPRRESHGGKPGGKREPKKWDKPRDDADAPASKPEGKSWGKPRTAPTDAKPKSKGTTAPVDWNDAPEERRKKPKGGAKPSFGGKPKGGPAKDHDGAVSTPKKHRKSGDGHPASKRMDGPPRGKPKSKPPAGTSPAGKPSSKKNRARQAAVKAASKAGGNTPPKRKG
ncbi:DEAD/DEAH box helicase [Octadecabacter sp. G9-8]|uniref:DEAD/DEAH box helicase n=1 Tax=Octadecabacter dasysiphoniae TaxID=2909341 RepID=A0ABS9CSZ9_9RHOB|nr:DEAD/DEAH box helicase [Octadecabacter dasysiphoniae]